jgi:hypothetical protein
VSLSGILTGYWLRAMINILFGVTSGGGTLNCVLSFLILSF